MPASASLIRRSVAAASLLAVAAAFAVMGCGKPRYVATVRGRIAMTYGPSPQRLRVFGPAFCEPTCAFAKRPGERVAGCDYVMVDREMEAHLELPTRDMIYGDSMILCELR